MSKSNVTASLALIVGIGALAAGPVPACAQGAIELVVPYAPGGASDFLGRVLAPEIEELGETTVVQNMPGAGTAIGAQAVAAAEPDGSTLLLATSTTLAINETLFPDLAYDPVSDFTPVGLVADVPFVLVVPQSLGVATFEELRALAKERELTYGSAGNGSPHHLFAALMMSEAGFEAVHVPYQGSAPAIVDLLGGQVDFMMADLAPALPQLTSGGLKALAISTAERLPMLPDVPTLAEAGVEGYEATAWQGIVGPAGLPQDVVDRLDAKLRETLADPAVVERLAAGGLVARTSTPAEFETLIASEIERWGAVVRASGASIN